MSNFDTNVHFNRDEWNIVIYSLCQSQVNFFLDPDPKSVVFRRPEPGFKKKVEITSLRS